MAAEHANADGQSQVGLCSYDQAYGSSNVLNLLDCLYHYKATHTLVK